MFYQRVVIRPEIGKRTEVKALLEERVAIDQARLSMVLTERLLAREQSFVVGIMHENLEAFEKARDSSAADADFGAFQSKLIPLLKQSGEQSLYSVVSRGNVGGSHRYTHLVRFKPARDKEAEVQAALEEFVAARESEGASKPSILRRLFSMEGPMFILVNPYENLTEYENITLNRPPSVLNVIKNTNDIITEPTAHGLFEIIRPLSG